MLEPSISTVSVPARVAGPVLVRAGRVVFPIGEALDDPTAGAAETACDGCVCVPFSDRTGR